MSRFLLISILWAMFSNSVIGQSIKIVEGEEKNYIGSISYDDVNLILELRHYPNLYNKILKDVKRSANIINKRVMNQ